MPALRALLVGILMALALAGCASSPPEPQDSYIVQEHDTLYSIAWRHGLDYRDLARWNGLGADYRIAIGQRLALHPTGVPEGRAVAAGGAVAPRPAATEALPPAPASPVAERLAWVWPTAHRTPPVAARSGGLLFAGEAGQPVRAAAAGRVVYTGSGIRGYGQLIIIKHSATQLSSYAYNDQVLVHEGQELIAGQPIATMGLGPRQAPALYFEIRVNGRPVNPMGFLSGRK